MTVTAIHQEPVATHSSTAGDFDAAVTAAKQTQTPTQTPTQTQQIPWGAIEGALVQAMTPYLMLQVQTILGLATDGGQD